MTQFKNLGLFTCEWDVFSNVCANFLFIKNYLEKTKRSFGKHTLKIYTV